MLLLTKSIILNNHWFKIFNISNIFEKTNKLNIYKIAKIKGNSKIL